jgi:hypothetical protein
MTTLEGTRKALHRRGLIAAAVAVIGFVAVAKVAADAPAPVDVDIIDRETGEAARVWRHAGRLHVAGQTGARYSLRVTNNTPGRLLVVMSVDGVNVLTGETAGYGQSGYVFRPYESYEVTGWRKSDSEVAAFTFAPLSRSYAARTGRPRDVGVIGVAAFNERVVRPLAVAPSVSAEARTGRSSADSAAAETASAAPPALSSPRSERLGTEHGAREWSAVTTTAFQRATRHPQFVRRIEYDSFENLVANGVIPRSRFSYPGPRPFPSSPEWGGYVPDPPGGR